MGIPWFVYVCVFCFIFKCIAQDTSFKIQSFYNPEPLLDKNLTNTSNLEHPCFLSLSNEQAFEPQLCTSQSLNRKKFNLIFHPNRKWLGWWMVRFINGLFFFRIAFQMWRWCFKSVVANRWSADYWWSVRFKRLVTTALNNTELFSLC